MVNDVYIFKKGRNKNALGQASHLGRRWLLTFLYFIFSKRGRYVLGAIDCIFDYGVIMC